VSQEKGRRKKTRRTLVGQPCKFQLPKLRSNRFFFGILVAGGKTSSTVVRLPRGQVHQLQSDRVFVEHNVPVSARAEPDRDD
jgi:hypothetical protein